MGKSQSKPSDAEERLLHASSDGRDAENGVSSSTQAPEVPPAAAAADNGERYVTTGRLFSETRPHWKTLFIATIALVISSACSLAQPMFFGRIISVASSDDGDRLEQLNRLAFLLLVILAVGGVATIIRGWLYTLVGERIVRDLRSKLFSKIVEQDVAFFDTNKTGELMNRLASDTAVIQSCLSVNISMGLRSMAEIVVSIVLLFITSWQLTCVMIAIVPALVVIVISYGRYTRDLTKELQDALAHAAETGSETISNARTMKSFGAESLEQRKYHDCVGVSYQRGATKALAYGIFAGGLGFLAGAAILVVVYYGATLVIHDHLTVGDLTAFVLYTLYIAMGLGIFSGLYTEFMNALGASDRIFRLLDTTPAIPVRGGEWPRECTGQVVFEKVSFSYPSRPDVAVLRDFSLTVSSNQTVALVGASGSGKSTVLALLERFYDISSGCVTIDGRDIRHVDPRWLHRNLAIVPQEPALFSGSIRSNIAYARAAASPELWHSDPQRVASQEEIERAGRQANAHDFIMSFPEGYDTLVGERGVRLSGGQKQRIAIARALLADPRILLLDEATSALDAESEMLVQDAITQLMRNRTVIVIAHRLSTVKDADLIAVFRQGKIVDQGTHAFLLQHSETYANLVRKQLTWGADQDTASRVIEAAEEEEEGADRLG